MRLVILLLIAAAVMFGCMLVTVQTNTGEGAVTHDSDKGAVILKPRPNKD